MRTANVMLAGGLLGLLASALSVIPASAQATRTWVSGVGDDANPCNRTAPCKTFAGAISKTAINGEINCLDPGGYGNVTITKSITIDCDDTLGSILASGVNGVIINIAVSANDPLRSVRLRGLSINGAGASGTIGTRTGIEGVRIDAATTVFIENVTISNNTQNGILDRRTTGGKLFITDSMVRENGTGTTGGGVTIRPSSGAGGILAAITRTRVEGNVFGIIGDLSTSTGGINMTIADSMIAGNSQDGIIAIAPAGAGGAAVMVKNTQSVNNAIGVRANNATIRLDGVTTSGNGTGITASNGGNVLSFGNNSNQANSNNGAPTGSVALQ